jgi:hypothetical protein
VAELELELSEAGGQLIELETELKEEMAKTAPKRGRPAGHRGADHLNEFWDDMNYDARRQAFWRHCQDIRQGLDSAGIHEWLPSALAVVLDSLHAGEVTWVDQLFSTRPFCLRKNELITDLGGILRDEWGVDLAQHAITEVGLSERQYQALRNCFSKSQFTPQNTTSDVMNRAGMYSKRRWYTCPVTGTIFHLPEPLQPMYRVQEAIAAAVKPMGLHLSVDGKISERSFLSTLQQTFRRDAVCLKMFDVSRPAHPCFGIDHATISGARDFTQGGITMGGCYKSGSLLSEQKHVTLCIGLHHDDGSGLQAMLGPKPASESAGEVRPAVVGIAAEFAALSDSGVLEVDGACIPCEPVVCLDFAAFRGITRKRGKCSALCACRGLAALPSYPGANGIPDLPSGDTVDDLHAARAIAQSQCGYGTAKLELPSLQSATHLLPEGWDFELNGPWHCSWCDEDVWTEFGQQTAFQLKLAALRARAASGAGESDSRKEAKKELDSILKEHADLHGDALLLEPLIMTNMSGTICMIVDPMHCLELNLAKTLWKYSFGDRMTAADRELVAEYLSAIGLHLDIREKGKRDPGQKWFSSAQVDEFVLGDAHYSKSKSPGLVKNILAIIELIFDKHTVADSLAAATDSSPPLAKKPKTARKDRHTAPTVGGFGAAEVRESGLDPASTAHLSIDELQGTAGDRASILSYLRQRYGNQAGVVIQILIQHGKPMVSCLLSGVPRGRVIRILTVRSELLRTHGAHATSRRRSALYPTTNRSRGTHTLLFGLFGSSFGSMATPGLSLPFPLSREMPGSKRSGFASRIGAL